MTTPKGKAESLLEVMRIDWGMPEEYAKQCAIVSTKDTIKVLEELIEVADKSSEIAICIMGNIAYHREVLKELSN